MVKMDPKVQNDEKRSKWSKMVQNGQNSQNGQNGPKWSKLVKMARGAPKLLVIYIRSQMHRGGPSAGYCQL